VCPLSSQRVASSVREEEQSSVWVRLYWISDKEWCSSSAVGRRSTAAHRKYHYVTKYYNRVWTALIRPKIGATRGCCEHVKENSEFHKTREFLQKPSNYHVFNKVCVFLPWWSVEKRLLYFTTAILLTLFVERLTGKHVSVMPALSLLLIFAVVE
jgi:hypothetical protein